MNRSILNLDLGMYKWEDGARYEGDWHDDKAYGRGAYMNTDCVKYEGEWKDKKQTTMSAAKSKQLIYNYNLIYL